MLSKKKLKDKCQFEKQFYVYEAKGWFEIWLSIWNIILLILNINMDLDYNFADLKNKCRFEIKFCLFEMKY